MNKMRSGGPEQLSLNDKPDDANAYAFERMLLEPGM